ncbi:hypothetical protein [Lacinutrix sp. Bg11-31]|uniref:hypothetical protein n=1 Tax=Lacinutrix sp. Bg11-31 TaxID=2057808 RepID=UPI000C310BC9|nr:hypothetical protein [Lacinutrix sp. Bg11-31]AUC83146.1 hypothetical protein CW733_13805 [Lacinutrix sp. Bg11-31]
MKNLASKSLFIICIALAVLLFKECEANKNSDCNYEDPTGLITQVEAELKEETFKKKEMLKNNVLLQVLNNDLDNQDAIMQLEIRKQQLAAANIPVGGENREVWFDLENLENYINYVKTKSTELGYENLGLRVYFAAKEDGNVKTTVFFAPTYREGVRGAEDDQNTVGIDRLNFGNSGMPAFEHTSGGN